MLLAAQTPLYLKYSNTVKYIILSYDATLRIGKSRPQAGPHAPRTSLQHILLAPTLIPTNPLYRTLLSSTAQVLSCYNKS